MQSDYQKPYTEILNDFYLLYPEKNKMIKLNDIEMKTYVNNFCDKMRIQENTKYFKMLVNRQGLLFKGLKCTLLPKLKMEVILNIDDKTTENEIKLKNNIWSNIWLLYIINESEQSTPDQIKISQLAMAIDFVKNDGKLDENMDQKSKIMDIMTSQMTNMTNEQKEQMNTMINALKNPSNDSNTITKQILTDIKEHCIINCEENGNVDSKNFVEQILKAGSSMSEVYGKKLKNKEISITDILGMISNITEDNGEIMNELSDLTETLHLDKVDLNSVMKEFTEQLNNGELKGKIPPEIVKTLTELNGDNLKNMDLNKLLNSMLSSNTETPKDLTAEQEKELEDFYSNLTI